MGVFQKKLKEKTEKISHPKTSGSGEPCERETMEWCILKRFSPQGRGLSANSSERYAAKQNHSKGTWLRKLKKGYVRSAPPSGGPPVTVEGQGGQNQLYERSTENDVFQMKTERKTEEKIPPQIFGK